MYSFDNCPPGPNHSFKSSRAAAGQQILQDPGGVGWGDSYPHLLVINAKDLIFCQPVVRVNAFSFFFLLKLPRSQNGNLCKTNPLTPLTLRVPHPMQ